MWLVRNRTLILTLTILVLLAVNACLPKSPSESGGGINITVYGFSIMKESLEKAIYPAFVAKVKREHGLDIRFTSSFAGSETVTNQILQGVKAQIAILSIERDAQRLKEKGFVTSDWHQLPQKGIVNKTPFVIIVRKGNPKGIHDFSDLAKPGIKLIHPDPVSSGGAQWSILAIYGSELVKSDKQTGGADHARAVQMLQAVWRNVISTPGSAREARTQFESGYGDALITYELDALLMKEGNAKADAEIVIPEATILSEHPAVVIDRNVSAADRPVIDGFMQYLWSEEAQRAFVKFHFRSATNDALTQENKELATIKYPFTVDYFGGWDKAYPEVIEGIFRDTVQKRK
ncbi:MAG: sulfate/thiosulfate transport system substrate-binding protein [Blastocatellia bacterium]|jgi:sulfate transport system substrate-binding protein|nr:sulfate/thiosulfate transport system substrate-binding protein [Blastocatellia bacterium]